MVKIKHTPASFNTFVSHSLIRIASYSSYFRHIYLHYNKNISKNQSMIVTFSEILYVSDILKNALLPKDASMGHQGLEPWTP